MTFNLKNSRSKMEINQNLTVLGLRRGCFGTIFCDLLLGTRMNLIKYSFFCFASWGLPENLKVIFIVENSWKTVKAFKNL